MTSRSRWLGAGVGILTVASMAFSGFAVSANAAAPQTHAKKVAKADSRCKKRVVAKGTAKFSDWQFPSNLNSFQNSEQTALNAENFLFDGLYYYDNHLKLKPDMLTVIPTAKNGGVTNGGKTITLHLKSGIVWKNGTTITSGDVKFGWQVGMNADTGPACSGSCDIISRIDTPNATTAVLHLKKAYAPAVPNAFPPVEPRKWTASTGGWTSVAEAAHQLGQNPAFNFEDNTYPTNGPYEIASVVKDDRITYQINPKYNILSCGGYVKNLIFAFYSDKPPMEAAASAGQTDVTNDYTLADIPTLQKSPGFKTLVDPALGLEHLEFNNDATYNGKPNPMSNLKFRQGVALAIDRVGLIQSALGISKASALASEAKSVWIHTKTVSQPFADPAITGQWDPLQKKYVQPGVGKALADAKKLISQSGLSGSTIDFFTTSGNPTRAAQEAVIANGLAKAGVHVNPNFVPSSKLFGNWDNGSVTLHGTFQIAMFAFFFTGPDPDGSKYNFQSQYIDRDLSVHGALDQNDAGVRDSVINKDYNTGAFTVNNSVRKKAYYDVQVRVNQRAYWFPLYYRPVISTTNGHVKGVSNNPTGSMTWNPWAWRT